MWKERNYRIFDHKELGKVGRVRLLSKDMLTLTPDCKHQDGQVQILENWNILNV